MGALIQGLWIRLRRDRGALVMTFVLPVIFFSIFAVIFGGMSSGGDGTNPIRVAVADLDGSETSTKLLEALDADSGLKLIYPATETEEGTPIDPETEARDLVQRGKVPAALIVPEGFSLGFGDFSGEQQPIRLIYDAADPVARHQINGLLQAAAMQAAPSQLMTSGFDQLEAVGFAISPEQQQILDDAKAALEAETESGTEDADGGESGGFTGLVQVEAEAAQRSDDGQGPSLIAYYAAGIGVMFLLFSMSSSSAALLDESENGTLERLLSSTVGMGDILAANWLFSAALGIAQLVVMFLWAWVVFDFDLFDVHHLSGLSVMVVVTALAASALGILLATIARSRAQLSSLSTVVILVMSAVGGSMVPRFVMPAFMNTAAKLTFNGWALDGFLKVFWYRDPELGVIEMLVGLWPELLVLAAMTAIFMALARQRAKRWECA